MTMNESLMMDEINGEQFEISFSYLAGMVNGDAWLNEYLPKNSKTPEHHIGLRVTDKDFVIEFKKHVGTIIGIQRKQNKLKCRKCLERIEALEYFLSEADRLDPLKEG